MENESKMDKTENKEPKQTGQNWQSPRSEDTKSSVIRDLLGGEIDKFNLVNY